MQTNRGQFAIHAFRISSMVLFLVGIVYAMHYLKSDQFTKSVENFFYMTSAWNWCPQNTAQIQKVGFGTDPVEFQQVADLCQIVVEPITQNSKEFIHFSEVLVALSETENRILEATASRDIFRVQGRVFKSKNLKEKLKNIEK